MPHNHDKKDNCPALYIIKPGCRFGAPIYDNITIPKYSNAAITIKNPEPGNYALFANAAGTTAMQQSNTGDFIVPNIVSDTNFYIKGMSGTCSSPAVQVIIKVVDESYFAIPKAFSPNK